MKANRSQDTGPEIIVRKLIHAMGLRYRKNVRPVPSLRRTADIVFPRHRVAVFIDGCFWHGCPEHYRQPRVNAEYWTAKISGNRKRDTATDKTLTEANWRVLRFWEHEDPVEVAETIRMAIRESQKQRTVKPKAVS